MVLRKRGTEAHKSSRDLATRSLVFAEILVILPTEAAQFVGPAYSGKGLMDERSKSYLEGLLQEDPCRLTTYILRVAKHFIYKHGLGSQVDPEDIRQDVIVALWNNDLGNLKHTFEDTRNYVTVMTRNEVDRAYKKIYGRYTCSNCAYFVDETNELPSHCGNPFLNPLPGQQYVQVDHNTKPKSVIHSEGNGCAYHCPRQFVGLDGDNMPTVPEESKVEGTLRYMEGLGPRQREQAKLIRLLLQGYSHKEIAQQLYEDQQTNKHHMTSKHRTTITKELHGTTEKEAVGIGERVTYHQAGALNIFRAIETGVLFKLEREHEDLWAVVYRRDLSLDAVQPGFNKIGSEIGISKREAIKRYIDGWEWMRGEAKKKGGSYVEI